MTHYLDIRMRPVPDMSPVHVMEAVFSKIHNALAMLQCTRVGVSFPEVNPSRPALGACLRLHGSADELHALLTRSRLSTMDDYLEIGGILPAPETKAYRVVSRVQAKSNPERLRRRLARRHGLSAEEAAARIPDDAARMLRLPFIRVTSASNGNAYRLFIDHGPLRATPSEGEFSAYGLSATATVPWF